MPLQERFSIVFVKYGLPEVREVSRKLPGARGFAVIEYGPVASHGDPIQTRSYNVRIPYVLFGLEVTPLPFNWKPLFLVQMHALFDQRGHCPLPFCADRQAGFPVVGATLFLDDGRSRANAYSIFILSSCLEFAMLFFAFPQTAL